MSGRNILCKLGIHKTDNTRYLVVYKTRGRHKWHRNYAICERCGKRLASFGVRKRKEETT